MIARPFSGTVCTRRRRAAGTSLVEILVAFVVLSIGVLAVAGLQLTARRGNAEAAARTLAARLASDLADRMRANPAALEAYRGQFGSGGPPTGDAGSSPPDCARAACTAADLARHDLQHWEALLLGTRETVAGHAAGGLVSPTACVTGGGGTFTITLAWRAALELPDDPSVECGRQRTAGMSLYSRSPDADDNRFRRTLTLPVFVAPAA
jgi:type IV pilus assembly protein PilV